MADIVHYKLGEVLGVGTVGTVYRAKDLLTGEAVAIKILLPQISVDSHVAQRFQREMSILEKLDHPHIVHYLTGGSEGGRLYCVMELVDAGSLKDELIIRGHLPWQQVCCYGIQVCSALQHAHNHGIIHRDLKPSNLFMDTSKNLKLGDFGIARDTHQTDLTDVGLTVGTYAYMSPEQICAELNISDRTDLYALGCLLYEMLTGHQPFEGANFAQIFDKHLHADPPRVREAVPECPEELEQIIVQMMAKNAADRPFNARYIQGFLQDLLQQKGDLVASPSVGSKRYRAVASPQLSRYGDFSWLLIIALLFLVGLILAGVLGLKNFIF